MKNKSIFSGFLPLLGIVLFGLTITSCEENDVDASGMARVKVVNASPNSAAQRFFLVEKSLFGRSLNFSGASNYVSTNSGKALVAEFKNELSSSVTAKGWAYLLDGDSYTIYLAGEGSDERVKQYEDDLSAPADGMARIKFIDFSNEAPSLLTIKNASGDDLIGTLTRDIESKYLNVTPGIFTFKVYDFVRKDKIGDYEIKGLQAGKIYTIYFTGSQDSDIDVHQIVHN